MTPAALTVSSLIGEQIAGTSGERLGTLKDIVIDTVSGTVAYAVLARGGLGGLGEKLFAVPWPMLEVNEEDRRLFVDVDAELLDDSPGFDPDNWPDSVDDGWSSEAGHRFVP